MNILVSGEIVIIVQHYRLTYLHHYYCLNDLCLTISISDIGPSDLMLRFNCTSTGSPVCNNMTSCYYRDTNVKYKQLHRSTFGSHCLD